MKAVSSRAAQGTTRPLKAPVRPARPAVQAIDPSRALGPDQVLRLQRTAGNRVAAALVAERRSAGRSSEPSRVIVQRTPKVGYEFEVGWGVRQEVQSVDQAETERQEVEDLQQKKRQAEQEIDDRLKAARALKRQEMGIGDVLFRMTAEYRRYLVAKNRAAGSRFRRTPNAPTAGVLDISDKPFVRPDDVDDDQAERSRLQQYVASVFPDAPGSLRTSAIFAIRPLGGGLFRVPAPIDLESTVTRAQVTTNLHTNVLGMKRDQGYINVPKASEIMEGPSGTWDLTADMNSGQSQLEWVTHPLTSRGQVDTAMTQVTAMAEAIVGRGGEGMIDATFLQEDGLGTFKDGFKPPERLVILPSGAMLGAPQLTGDFKLGQLLGLMTAIKDNEEGAGSLAGKSVSGKEAGHLDSALSAARLVTDEDVGGANGSDALGGFLALALNYLYTGQDALDNSKGLASGFMSRTDFVHNYALLPERERLFFGEDPGRLAVLAKTVTDKAGRPLALDGEVFEKGYKVKAADTEVHRLPLTRRQWLEGIVNGSDALTKAVNDTIHKSLGGLGNVNAKKKEKGEDEIDTTIVELRRMLDGLPVDRWKDVALLGWDTLARYVD